MSTFSYLKEVDNDILSESTLTADNADADFPASNLAVLPVSKPCIINKLSAQKILISFDSAKAITVLALISHNLTSAATITLRAGSSHDPDGSSFQTTMTWTRRNAVAVFASQSYQYWSIEISDTANRDGFLKIGLLRAGTLTVPGFHFNYGWTRSRSYQSIRPRTEFGTPHISPLYSSTENRWDFTPITAAYASTISDLLDDLKGDGTPILVLPTDSGTECYYGRFISGNERTTEFYISTQLVFLEDGPGRTAVKDDPFSYIAGTSIADLDGVFTRATGATYTNDGLKVQSAADNSAARIAHFPNKYVRTLLLEETRTNEWTQSEDFSHAGWTKVDSLASPGMLTAPAVSKIKDANFIKEGTSAGAAHGVERVISAGNNANQAVSIMAAAGTRTWLYIETTDKSGLVQRSWVNLGTGVVSPANAGHTLRVRSLANSFTGIEAVFNASAGGTTPKVRFGLASAASNVTYTGDGVSGLYLWGAQQERDAGFASSYFPTVTSSGTLRAAETLYFPFADIPKSMTVYVRFVERGIGVSGAGLLYIGAATEAGALLKIQSTGTAYIATLDNGLGATASSTTVATPSIGDIVELRVTVTEAGVVTINQTINAGSEVAATASAAIALPATFQDKRLYLNSRGTANRGIIGIASAKVFRGVQSLSVMRGND